MPRTVPATLSRKCFGSYCTKCQLHSKSA